MNVYHSISFHIEISRIPGLFFQDDYMRELGIDPKTQLISIYRNPYSYEIHSKYDEWWWWIDIEFPEWELSGNVVFNTPSNVEELELISIVTEDGIVQLIKELQECNVISVSVIQHSYRSYLGYCSVIMVRAIWFIHPFRFHHLKVIIWLMLFSVIVHVICWMRSSPTLKS